MLNIQLFFENQEVELNNSVSFPLNKTFENLWNPTDIIVEYSKSINIPATPANNKLMMNAYRIDRQFNGGDASTNLGMYLNPLKRIPMRLMYNGTVLLDGYAKYTSSTVNAKQIYYTFNLYGALGDVFQSLMDCVVDEDKLTDEQKAESDGGNKYVIKTPWTGTLINKDLVKTSWKYTNTNFNNLNNLHNCIGFAPAYRGLYDNFESNSALGLLWQDAMTLEEAVNTFDSRLITDGQTTTTTTTPEPSTTTTTTPEPSIAIPTIPPHIAENMPEVLSVEDQLKQCWIATLMGKGYTKTDATARVDALDFETIIPNGLSEHQIRQFRSYEQKPYIYLPALLKLFQNKCTELTGYKINLDTTWFNDKNPYYNNMCYMFDYLSIKGSTLKSSSPFTSTAKQNFTNLYQGTNDYCELASFYTYDITNADTLSTGNITVRPFTVSISQSVDKQPSHDASKCKISLFPWTRILVQIAVTTNNETQHYYYWGATGTYGKTDNLTPPNTSRYNKDNFIKATENTTYNSKTNKLTGTAYLTIPRFTFNHIKGNSISIKYTVSLYCDGTSLDTVRNGTYIYGNTPVSMTQPTLNNDNYQTTLPNIEYDTNWRTKTECLLKNLYAKDEPLFKVLLQYTKMMGLIWKPNYANKTIDIVTRKTYFDDYQIVDWTNKVDRNKGIVIEPVSFNSKFVTFNYEDVEGNRYSGYKNRFGVDYGEKKIKTKYNFDNNETNLFKDKIHPSSVSCKSLMTIDNLQTWDTISMLQYDVSETNFIDCENEDQTASITMNNWYFRCPNIETTESYYISDVSTMELEQDKYFWVGNELLEPLNIGVEMTILPQFSPVIKVDGISYGCLFNCPNEDYTSNQQIASAKGNYIYDVCWSDYINERYNANNKKITCYMHITPVEFTQFNNKTFVIVDNQLFIMNKIFDYDIKNPTTKVELIQVSNINGYINQNYQFV